MLGYASLATVFTELSVVMTSSAQQGMSPSLPLILPLTQLTPLPSKALTAPSPKKS